MSRYNYQDANEFLKQSLKFVNVDQISAFCEQPKGGLP